MSSFVSIANLPQDMGFATFFWHLYEKRLNTDVEFDLLGPNGHVTFSAHKIVLALWSPYFADKFFGTGKEKKMGNVVNILQFKDVNPEAFEAMLRFMYGNRPSLQNHKKACQLYKVAIKFQVNSLQKACRQFLNEVEVTPSNVFDILDASKYMGNESRVDTCLKLIQDRTQEVMDTFDLSSLSSSMLNFFLDLPKMSLSGEFSLLMWVFTWAVNKCGESNRYSNIREVLEEFLPKLNFLALTNEEFTKIVSQWPNFFNKDEIISIYMNLSVPGSKEMPYWYDKNRAGRKYNESNSFFETTFRILSLFETDSSEKHLDVN